MTDREDQRVEDAEYATQFRPRTDDDDRRARWVRDGPLLCLGLYKTERALARRKRDLERDLARWRSEVEREERRLGEYSRAVRSRWPTVAAHVEAGRKAALEGEDPADRGLAAAALARRLFESEQDLEMLQIRLETRRRNMSSEKRRLEREIPEHESDIRERQLRVGRLESQEAGLRDDLSRAARRYAEIQNSIDTSWAEAITLLRRQEGELGEAVILERYRQLKNSVGRRDAYFEQRIEDFKARIEAEREAARQAEIERARRTEAARAARERERARASSVEQLGLTTATVNALLAAGVTTAGQLCDLSREELIGIAGIGQARLAEIEQALWDAGLAGGW